MERAFVLRVPHPTGVECLPPGFVLSSPGNFRMPIISTVIFRIEYRIMMAPEMGKQEYKILLGIANTFVTSRAKIVNRKE
jgi:hypothetical protein